MTYYKYAERQADSQVNWAEVSKGLSDTILKIDSDRQAKKAAIDEATREAQIELANAPQGENTTANAWTINLAHDMMNYRLTIDKLLKSGQMNLKDYQVATQNSADSTELVFTIAQEYQNEYKAIMDRSRTVGKNGLFLSSVLEPELAALNESYANLSNTVPTINSTNGMLYLSNPGTGKDGVQTLGDNYVSLQSLRNRMKARVDNYDVKGISAAAVATLGENTIAQLNRDENFRRTGVVTTTTDATKLTQIWAEFTEKTAEDMITNPFARASILADAMRVNPKNGKAYTGVYNRAEWEADKTGNLILFENTNGTGPLVPVFTDQQTKDAKEFVKAGFSKYVDRKEDKRPFTEPGTEYAPEYVYNRGQGVKANKETGNMLAKFYSGDDAEIQSAVDYFSGLSDVSSVVRTPDGIDVTLTTTGETKTIRFNNPNGKRKTQDDFIRSASKILVGDDADLNEVLKGAIGTGKKAFNATGSASATAKKPAAPLTAEKKAANFISAAITPDMINKTEKLAVPELSASLNKLGFDVKGTGTINEWVTITAPKKGDVAGASKEFRLEGGPEAAKKVRQSIIDFVTTNLEMVSLTNAERAGVFGGGELDN